MMAINYDKPDLNTESFKAWIVKDKLDKKGFEKLVVGQDKLIDSLWATLKIKKKRAKEK